MNCRVCGLAQMPDGGDLCATCGAAIAAPEHAAQAKIVTTPAGAFREGMPAVALPPPQQDGPRLNLLRPAVFIVLLLFAGTAVSLLLPKLDQWREASDRTQSTNNLKAIGLAFHNFHDAHKRLPFNGAIDARPRDNTSGSWAFQIVPFLDAKPLLHGVDRTKAIPVYLCPGRRRPELSVDGAWSDYCLNPWINDNDGRVNAPDAQRRMVGITRGTAVTIFVGHGCIDPDLYSLEVTSVQTSTIFTGGHPATARSSKANHVDTIGDRALDWGGPFAAGGLMCMGDATVRIFPYDGNGNAALKLFLPPVGENDGWLPDV